MDNHVHLLPSSSVAGAVSMAMRAAGQAYLQALNPPLGRSGTLWQGRFKSCLVDSDRYLLTVLRYIELNPVRVAMITEPEAYRWSSVHVHLRQTCDPLLTLHPVYLALGSDIAELAQNYAQWLHAGVDADEQTTIRRHATQERAFGDERFQRMVEKALNRPAACRSRGRPRKGEMEIR